MGRRAVEVIVDLLDVLAVVALGVGQSEQALLEDRVLAVPQRQRHAKIEMLVAEAGDPILAPAIGAAARLVVRQIIPGGAVFAVVLAHRAPLPLAEIGPPEPPWRSRARLFEPASFRRVDNRAPAMPRRAAVALTLP